MKTPESCILKAMLEGYVAGIAWGERQVFNPYSWVQAEAWSWENGLGQGRQHRANSGVRDELHLRQPEKFEVLPIHHMDENLAALFEAMEDLKKWTETL